MFKINAFWWISCILILTIAGCSQPTEVRTTEVQTITSPTQPTSVLATSTRTSTLTLQPSQTLTKTLTNTPVLTPTQLSLSIGDKAAAKKAFEAYAPDITDYAIWDQTGAENGSDTVATGTVSLNDYPTMTFSVEWCARTLAIVDSNKNNVQFNLVIDGQDVPQDKQYSTNYTDIKGNTCLTNIIVITKWQYGTHLLTRKINYLKDISDGTKVINNMGSHTDAFSVKVNTPEELTAERQNCYNSIDDAELHKQNLMSVLYCDTFDHNQGYQLGSFEDDYAKYDRLIADNVLRFVVTTKQGFMKEELTPLGNKSFTDFGISVSVNGTGTGDADYGIVFRSDPKSNSFYYFYVINDSNTFGVGLSLNGELKSLQEEKNSNAININDVNQLTVIGIKNKFDCIINGQTVYSFQDDNLKEGEIHLAFEFDKSGEAATLEFSNLAVIAP